MKSTRTNASRLAREPGLLHWVFAATASRTLINARAACTVGLALLAAGAAHAAVWENTGWALKADVTGELVYDSNLYGRSDDVSDTYAAVEPGLLLERKGSLTKLEVRAQANVRRFFDLSDLNSVDPLFNISYAFPVSDEDLINQEAEFRYNRHSYLNTDLGERIRSTDYLLRWDGNLVDTGKATLGARARFERNTVDRENARNERARLGVFASYRPRELLELRAGYDYFDESFDSDTQSDRTRRAHQLTLQARGELAPKWTGSVEVGFLDSSYDPVVAGSGFDWSASANVTWDPSERENVNFNVSRYDYFTVDGGAANTSNLNVRYYRGFSGGYGMSLRGGYQTVDANSAGAADYDVLLAGASFEYDLTGRLQAEVGLDWRKNDATDRLFDYWSVTAFARFNYGF
jgi:hypothetical protein